MDKPDDREAMIEKARLFLMKASGYQLIENKLADFAIQIRDEALAAAPVQFADNITANREAYKQGLKDGNDARNRQIAEAMEKAELPCPHCDGQGWYIVPHAHTGEAMQEQCPETIFVNADIREAVRRHLAEGEKDAV